MINKFAGKKVNIGLLNECVKNSAEELVLFSEQNYFNQLKVIADEIVCRKDVSIMLLAGPSASSKTTTSHKLCEALAERDIHAVVISLDDFYVDREDLPLLSNGDTDFESIETLDLEKISKCFKELINNRKSEFPLFDFTTGKRAPMTKMIEVSDNSILIIEGLHALNPLITKGQNDKNFIKLYISPTSDYYIGEEIVLTARDVRLVRRMIRDHFYRASDFNKTLAMWENVIVAEIESIIPFEKYADFIIDSTIIYEPNVYVQYLINLVEDVDESNIWYDKIKGVVKAISHFDILDIGYVPNDTVLREFLD